jgi:hypothetical protein
MEGRVQRALRDLQDIAAHKLYPPRNRPSVLRAARKRLEDEKVERALNQV